MQHIQLQTALVYHRLSVWHRCRNREITSKGTQVDQGVDEQSDEATYSDQVRPYIHGLVVQHEQGFAQTAFAVEVNAIAPLYVLIVDNVVRCLFDVADECLDLLLALVPEVLQRMLDVLHSLPDKVLPVIMGFWVMFMTLVIIVQMFMGVRILICISTIMRILMVNCSFKGLYRISLFDLFVIE